jgi:hypothetical protein
MLGKQLSSTQYTYLLNYYYWGAGGFGRGAGGWGVTRAQPGNCTSSIYTTFRLS